MSRSHFNIKAPDRPAPAGHLPPNTEGGTVSAFLSNVSELTVYRATYSNDGTEVFFVRLGSYVSIHMRRSDLFALGKICTEAAVRADREDEDQAEQDALAGESMARQQEEDEGRAQHEAEQAMAYEGGGR